MNSTIDPYVAAAVVGVLATCVGGLLWVIKFLFKELLPAFSKQTEVMNKLVGATTKNTAATKSADVYLRQRNGRDNEMHTELIKAVHEIPTQIIKTADITAKALQKAPINQHVEHQEVQEQTIGATK